MPRLTLRVISTGHVDTHLLFTCVGKSKPLLGNKMSGLSCLQMGKLQERLVALEAAGARTAAGPMHGPWALLLSIAVAAARAAAAASGSLAMLYCAITLPSVRTALYNALAAEPGSLRLPVLVVLTLAAFVAASVSSIADQWMSSSSRA